MLAAGGGTALSYDLAVEPEQLAVSVLGEATSEARTEAVATPGIVRPTEN
jgi:hypothetical protein